MTSSSSQKSSIAIIKVSDGSIIKEYRETEINLSWYTRGPEVGRTKPQSMLYASDETLHLGFRDNYYRNAFFTFSGGALRPTYISVF